jgi:LAO/AO transport system kinase
LPSDIRSGSELGARLAAGDRTAAPAALNLLETRTARDAAAALVSAAGDGAGHVVGVTGPPGVGKSTLLSALLREWRGRGRSVAVLAVDPSSKRSGGALLGDRARIEHDPHDRDVFIRSMAAGERLGGLAPATRAAAQALASAFDVVVIETVGGGQSETDVAEAVDTTVVVVQPGSGDALQFLKAGIMEVPDVLVVTKADLGASARRAEHDLRAALGALAARDTPVVSVSSVRPTSGIEALADAIEAHRNALELAATRTRAHRLGALADFIHEHGERGLRALGGRRAATRWLEDQEPGLAEPELLRRLEERVSAAGPG